MGVSTRIEVPGIDPAFPYHVDGVDNAGDLPAGFAARLMAAQIEAIRVEGSSFHGLSDRDQGALLRVSRVFCELAARDGQSPDEALATGMTAFNLVNLPGGVPSGE